MTDQSLTDASDGETTYEYDPVGNMTSITNPFGETTTIAYDALNREQTKTLANSIVVTHTYDDGGRETELSYTLGGSPVADFVSTYDNVGNRLTEIELDGSVTTYVYDANNQRTSEIRTGPIAYTGAYAYDAAGNRTTVQMPKLGSIDKPYNFSYAVDHANALESLTDTDSSTVYDYAYDNNGNLTAYDTPYNGTVGSVAHTWDEENRLTAVTAADGTVSTHAYAGDGMRRFRETPSGTTTFVWDHENVLQEFESDDSVVYYTEHPGASGGLISRREGSTTQLYIYDQSNKTRFLANSSGEISESYVYDAFGNLINSIKYGVLTSPMQVPGMDPTFGGVFSLVLGDLHLYGKQHGYQSDLAAKDVRRLYVRARHFDTETAKWMSRDPLGDVDGPNRYGYCGNDGVNFFDPHGTDGASNFHHHRKLRIKVGPTTYSHDPYYLAPTSMPSTNGYSIDMAHAAGSKDYLYWLDNDENYQATYAFAADQRLKQGAREQKAAADRDLMLAFVPLPGFGAQGAKGAYDLYETGRTGEWIFYSGETSEGVRAFEVADDLKGGAKTINDIALGKVAKVVARRLPKRQQEAVWRFASKQYAKYVKGHVRTVLINPKATAIYKSVEEPVLRPRGFKLPQVNGIAGAANRVARAKGLRH